MTEYNKKKKELWFPLIYKDYGGKSTPFFLIPANYAKVFHVGKIYKVQVFLHDEAEKQKVLPLTAEVRQYQKQSPHLVPIAGVSLPFTHGKTYLINIQQEKKNGS
jgi:hypothetical protein